MVRSVEISPGIVVRFERHEQAGFNPGALTRHPILEAYVDDEPIGYIQMSYDDKEIFMQRYPSAREWMMDPTCAPKRSGAIIRMLPESGEPAMEQLRKIIAASMHPEGVLLDANTEFVRDLSDEAVTQRWNERREFWIDEFVQVYEEVRAYYLNKPAIMQSYIVCRGQENERTFVQGRVNRQTASRNWRGVGIGRVMYEQAALWMAELGMNLYASTTRSDPAKAVWDVLDRKYGLDVEMRIDKGLSCERLYLDGSKIPGFEHSGASLKEDTLGSLSPIAPVGISPPSLAPASLSQETSHGF